jgi:hypothetical protein
MQYEDGQIVKLGDIIEIGLADGVHRARVVLLGDSSTYAGINEKTAKWAIESQHVDKNSIMAVWIDENPFAHSDPKYAPVANTISTDLCGIVLIRRGTESQPVNQGDGE